MRHHAFSLHTLLCPLLLLVLVGCSPASQSAGSPPAFDGGRSFGLLEKQVEMGPRVPGMLGHDKAAGFIEDQLKPYADGVQVQPFTATVEGKQIALTNIAAFFGPKSDKWILLMAHWDTRPRADYEATPSKRETPIPGANDGASGTAVLLELARIFAQKKPDVGVFLLFVDGEDYGKDEDGMYLGAKHFARNLDKCATVRGKKITFDYGILLDMVGDKNLTIYEERKSVEAAPEVVDKVWAAAKDLGYEKSFPSGTKYSIGDDHIPFINAGVKCIDLIDFDYAPWHTLGDTPDKCSPESLKTVGEVVARVIYSERSK